MKKNLVNIKTLHAICFVVDVGNSLEFSIFTCGTVKTVPYDFHFCHQCRSFFTLHHTTILPQLKK